MMALGQVFEEGFSTNKDLSKAEAYYSLASESEYFQPYAFYKIGILYEEGTHTDCIDGKPDRAEAFKQFKYAQNQENIEAENECKEAIFKIG
jgi:TPR repeat protein